LKGWSPMGSRSLAAALFLALSLPHTAIAASWRVELDGSGDFMEIQPAVDAAAPGDTILIGPGRFDTFHDCVAPGWTEETVVSLLKDNLVLIGSGQEVTIIGPETYYGTLNTFPKGICSFDGYTGVIRDLTIENVYQAIYWWTGHLDVDRCTMRAESAWFAGVAGTFSSASIRNCLIDAQTTALDAASAIILATGSTDVQILGTTFTGGGYGVRASNNSTGISIEDCIFEESGLGVSFDTSSTGEVRRCVFDNPTGASVAITNFCNVVCESLHTTGGDRGIIVAGSSVFEGTNLIIEGTLDAAVQLHTAGVANISNSHILPASGWAVECVVNVTENRIANMTNNYWGTADADSIARLIFDGGDNPDIHYTVVYEPFSSGPLPTEEQPLGSVKAMF